MSQDDDHEQALEVAAATVHIDHTIEVRRARDFARTAVTAYLSAMPQRLSPDLIAQLKKLASRLTAQGEYEACDLIDTVVARVSAMPGRELLREALEALEPFAADEDAWNSTVPDKHFPVVDYGRGSLGDASYSVGDLRRARAAADKIRAAMGGEK